MYLDEHELPATSLNDVVKMAIEDLFPDQIEPDKLNYLPDGNQHMAPDHEFMDGTIAVERKSILPNSTQKMYLKLQEISRRQGDPMIGVGQFNASSFTNRLPDPEAAVREFNDYLYSQTLKRLRDAAKKFVGYVNATNTSAQTRVVVLSDETPLLGSNASTEAYLVRKFRTVESLRHKSTPIHCIIYIKNPRYVMDIEHSYWFKSLIRSDIECSHIEAANFFSDHLHAKILAYVPYAAVFNKIQNGRYQPVLI